MVGMLHDLDYERYPDLHTGHPRYALAELERLGFPEDMVRAVASHADYLEVSRDTPMEKTLFAVDELSGFVMACAYVRPQGIDGPDAQVGQEEDEDAGVRRGGRPRRRCARAPSCSGIDFDEHVAFVVAALEPHAEELGPERRLGRLSVRRAAPGRRTRQVERRSDQAARRHWSNVTAVWRARPPHCRPRCDRRQVWAGVSQENCRVRYECRLTGPGQMAVDSVPPATSTRWRAPHRGRQPRLDSLRAHACYARHALAAGELRPLVSAVTRSRPLPQRITSRAPSRALMRSAPDAAVDRVGARAAR